MPEIWLEKYRPIKFEDVVGNSGAVTILRSHATAGTFPHLLLTGPPGCGKTTVVHCLAREHLGEHYEQGCIELNASDDRGIDVVREKIKGFAHQKVTLPEGKLKVIILDEADSMTQAAQQAMRRTMEIFSESTRFALACNISSKIIEPIQSRCAILRFSRISDEDMLQRLRLVLEKESATYDQSGLEALAFAAEGDMRNALNGAQSTFNAFGEINKGTVFRMNDQPQPEKVKSCLDASLKKDLKGTFGPMHEIWNQGYSTTDIISTFSRVAKQMEAPEHIKLEWLKEIGLAHARVTAGAQNLLQLDAMVSKIFLVSERGFMFGSSRHRVRVFGMFALLLVMIAASVFQQTPRLGGLRARDKTSIMTSATCHAPKNTFPPRVCVDKAGSIIKVIEDIDKSRLSEPPEDGQKIPSNDTNGFPNGLLLCVNDPPPINEAATCTIQRDIPFSYSFQNRNNYLQCTGPSACFGWRLKNFSALCCDGNQACRSDDRTVVPNEFVLVPGNPNCHQDVCCRGIRSCSAGTIISGVRSAACRDFNAYEQANMSLSKDLFCSRPVACRQGNFSFSSESSEPGSHCVQCLDAGSPREPFAQPCEESQMSFNAGNVELQCAFNTCNNSVISLSGSSCIHIRCEDSISCGGMAVNDDSSGNSCFCSGPGCSNLVGTLSCNEPSTEAPCGPNICKKDGTPSAFCDRGLADPPDCSACSTGGGMVGDPHITTLDGRSYTVRAQGNLLLWGLSGFKSRSYISEGPHEEDSARFPHLRSLRRACVLGERHSLG
ncbi:RFC2 [Symbiodinium pilosum]|uniref:RFC2 protein n=1 Tax=Symbiodinium pilosum TaxID=2952 RepID=A0A812SQX4_SYMPI|nr:RFC2 [Symbiodinium pilosum]